MLIAAQGRRLEYATLGDCANACRICWRKQSRFGIFGHPNYSSAGGARVPGAAGVPDGGRDYSAAEMTLDPTGAWVSCCRETEKLRRTGASISGAWTQRQRVLRRSCWCVIHLLRPDGVRGLNGSRSSDGRGR